jgi:DNA-binding transcriptional LysR family regulator
VSESITQTDPLLGVEIRHLVALATIARTGSFSAAGRELGYAQSAISQQIATLERAAGHRLLERPGGPRPVTLTEAGALVLHHADSITARLGAVRADLDGLAAGEAGRLRVGVFQSASARIVPAILPRFRQHWPNIDISLHNRSELPDLERTVMAGEVDLAFYELESISAALDSVELLVDPYVVVLPRNHPLAHRSELNWRDLEALDRISHSGRDACSLAIGKALREAGVTTNVVFETDDNLTLQRLVGVGLGIGVVASLAVEPITDDNTVVIPLDASSRLERRIGLVWHRDRYRSPSALGFIAVAKQAVADGL